MTLSEFFDGLLHTVATSWPVKGLAYGAAVFASISIIIAVLLAATLILHIFFKHHPFIRRARKILIYLLTICGVLALLMGGILGLVLPIIPGIVLILAGLLLLRKYHKFTWLENRIHALKMKLRREKKGVQTTATPKTPAQQPTAQPNTGTTETVHEAAPPKTEQSGQP